MLYQSWFEKVFPELTGQGLWLRGGELNTLSPSEWERRPFRVLWARLSTYWDTGDSFTHPFLYQIAADMEGVYPDLAYLPPLRDLPVFAREQIPWLLGTQSKRGPGEFDWIGISNSIVQELIHLPLVLKASGIPLSKSDRLERKDLPLLIMGGANALSSMVAWGDGTWVDGVFAGESTASIRRLLEIGRECKVKGKTKEETLVALEAVEGFFQPERLWKPAAGYKVRKARTSDLNEEAAFTHGPVPFLEESLGSAALQISEGCPCFCTFCAESWERKPYRERSAERILAIARRAKAGMGLEAIDLYSFNFNLHSGIVQLIGELAPRFRALGLKSQRFDLLAHHPVMAEFQHAAGKSSYTCGMEGISPRIRRYLRKNLSGEDLHRGLQAILKLKAREVKIFLIATGWEDPTDVAAFDDFLVHLKEIRQQSHSQARMIFSMTPLVRFPGTPLEFEDAPDAAHYERIISQVSARVKRAGFEFREAAGSAEYWVSQVLVRCSDERVSRALRRTVEELGFVYYREVSARFQKRFEERLQEEGLSVEELFRGFDLRESATKPWAAIETGVKREFLWECFQKAKQFVEEDYCLGREWSAGKCLQCGGCESSDQVKAIVQAKQKWDIRLADFQRVMKDARKNESILSVPLILGERSRGVPGHAIGVALARALLLCGPEWTDYYRGYSGRGWGKDARLEYAGLERFDLMWSQQVIPEMKGRLADANFRAEVNGRLADWAELASEAGVGRPDTLLARSLLRGKPENYLKSRDLKYTLRKEREGVYEFELTKDAIKKGYLKALKWEQPAEERSETRIILALGPKFDADEMVRFSKEAFILKRPEENVRVKFDSLP